MIVKERMTKTKIVSVLACLAGALVISLASVNGTALLSAPSVCRVMDTAVFFRVVPSFECCCW